MSKKIKINLDEKQLIKQQEENIYQIRKEMIGFKYKHYKLGKVYLVLDIIIHTETQELMVVYKNINDDLVWCRPLNIFNEEIDTKHHKRFEKIDDDIDWKNQQEQKIFKELKNIGWEVTFRNLKGIDFQNIIGQRISIYLTNKSYYSKATLSSKTHQLLHKLFELWGWFDE